MTIFKQEKEIYILFLDLNRIFHNIHKYIETDLNSENNLM